MTEESSVSVSLSETASPSPASAGQSPAAVTPVAAKKAKSPRAAAAAARPSTARPRAAKSTSKAKTSAVGAASTGSATENSAPQEPSAAASDFVAPTEKRDVVVAPRDEKVEDAQSSSQSTLELVYEQENDARAATWGIESNDIAQSRSDEGHSPAPSTQQATREPAEKPIELERRDRKEPMPTHYNGGGNGAQPPENRDADARGLRFRGRDGRAEVRGRANEPRPFRLRSDRPDNRDNSNRTDNRDNNNRENNNRTDNRDNNNRENAWRDNEAGGANRPNAPFRDNSNRDNNNRDNRDQNGRDQNRNADRSMDRIEREALRAKPEFDLILLEEKTLLELRDIARDMNVEVAATLKKPGLVFRLLEVQAEASGHQFKRGILEIMSDGKGFLRTSGYLAGDEDVYVSQSQIKRFNLKTGDIVSGQVRAPKEMERHFGLLRVEAINGEPPEAMKTRKEFEKLTPIFPDEKFKLETTQENITARIIDLVSPIGKGQRGLIVAPPKAGKTTLIKSIANSISLNHPEIILIVLLIDERPEEVTDISRSVKGEVVASTFDEMPENHMRVADMVFEKAKRLVEQKKDVVILLDSITRLSRASNLVVAPSGRTLSGGLDPAAMYRPKRMFGAARNIEEGGSLTILATTLVDTGSRMDDMIFEEFKGTGNLDLVLDRNLFDQRIFPAIDINKSGTRRDDLLLSKDDLAATFHLRRTLSALDNDKAITLLIDRLRNTKTNLDFMSIVQKSARQGGSSSGS